MGRLDLDFDRIRSQSGSGTVRGNRHRRDGFVWLTRRILEGLRGLWDMAEWLKVGLPVLAAILSAYVMIQGHDIKITRLETDMRGHLDEHKKEAKEAFEKLSRIEIAIERIETKVESLKGR